MLTQYLSAMAKSKYLKWSTGTVGIGRVSGVLWDSFPRLFCFKCQYRKLYSCAQFQVPWCPEVEATLPCASLHGSGVKKSTGRSGSMEQTHEWGSTSFHQSDTMTLRCSLHDWVLNAHCASETWTAQMWLLEWAKDILQGSASQMGPM